MRFEHRSRGQIDRTKEKGEGGPLSAHPSCLEDPVLFLSHALVMFTAMNDALDDAATHLSARDGMDAGAGRGSRARKVREKSQPARANKRSNKTELSDMHATL